LARGLNNQKMQQVNRSLILSLILEHPGISRLELAQITGLQKPTITNIVNELLTLGVVDNCEKPKIENQKKTKGLVFADDTIGILSVRLMRNEFDAALFTIKGQIVDQRKMEVNPNRDIERTLAEATNIINEILNQNSLKVLAMSLGLPGPYIRGIDGNDRIIVEGFSQLGEIDVAGYFRKKYSFPVIAEHDAHLSALCEWKNMSSTEREHVHCLLALQSIGIGIGAGLILNGKVLEGAFGIAGEIGNIGIYFNGPKNSNGERGTFEHYASTGNMKNYIAQRLAEFPSSKLTEESSYEEIKQAYFERDSLAVWAFEAVAMKLAYGLASVIFVINPDKIVIGPDYPEDENFINRIKNDLAGMINTEISDRIDIRFSEIRTDPTLLGGYEFVLQKFMEESALVDRIRALLST
jgi:predicted NBD/HSP70 family sugar kinase